MKRFRLPSAPCKSRPAKAAAARGFTLIEVVAVLILLGILAAVAVSRTMDNTAQARAAADRLKVHLRFAQMQAMNSESAWGVEAFGGGYRFFSYDWNGSAYVNKQHLTMPGEGDVVSLSGMALTGLPVSFDSWGRPYNSETPSGSSSGGSITVYSQTFTITAETGFMP